MNIFYPLQASADWFTYGVFSLTRGTLLAEAVNFFIFDTAKIFILLFAIIFTVSFLRTFLPPEKIRAILSRRNRYAGNFLAAVFGVAVPFCSCSAIPLFLGFLEAGVPLGVTFSFLVSSPMVNEVALVMLLGMFGLRIALVYILSGLAIAAFSGIVIGRMGAERLLKNAEFRPPASAAIYNFRMTLREKWSMATRR